MTISPLLDLLLALKVSAANLFPVESSLMICPSRVRIAKDVVLSLGVQAFISLALWPLAALGLLFLPCSAQVASSSFPVQLSARHNVEVIDKRIMALFIGSSPWSISVCSCYFCNYRINCARLLPKLAEPCKQ